jgi:TolB protein
MKKAIPVFFVTVAAFLTLQAQEQADLKIILKSGELPVIAVPDLRGAGEAQAVMGKLNSTLFADLQESGYFRMAPKSLYPLTVPQRPEDFRAPTGTPPRPQGPWLTDWSAPPVSANYLTMGYTAVQNGRLVLFGWLYNVNQPDLANAQVFGKLYFGSVDEAGATSVAHEFAADILQRFGAKSLAGTKIYFTRVHGRSAEGTVSEIWVMDYDGSNPRQLTKLGSISKFVDVSPDGSRIAFMTFAGGSPTIRMMSTESGRFLPFYNQRASLNSNPHFTPDGKTILFASTAAGGFSQIYQANLDGSNLRRVAVAPAVEVEPKVNPKTATEVVFTSGRSGPPQVYKMNLDGANAVRLTSGEGDAVNPSWSPDGQHIAFSWTRGYDPGNYNIFVMDVATRKYMQLTHGAGRNENPSWAPDGRHLVFSSNRSGSTQIWTMLADGTGLRQLTTQGRNENPVWSK